MKTYVRGFIVLSLVIVFFSCQKEVVGSLPNHTTSDSILLWKYVELDTSLPAGSDTNYQAIYSYDNQKRITHVYSNDYSFPDIQNADLFYSGNDTLPYKYILVSNDGSTTFRDTAYLSYTNGLVSLDSTIEWDITNNLFFGTSVASYTDFGNRTFIQRREYSLPAPSPVTDQWSGAIFKTNQNGDIIVQDDTAMLYPVHNDRAHYLVSYDNKTNPFYKTEIPYPVLNKFIVQKNNVTEETSWDVPGQINVHTQYTYIYRQDGYPVTATFADPPNPYPVKGFFFYKN